VDTIVEEAMTTKWKSIQITRLPVGATTIWLRKGNRLTRFAKRIAWRVWYRRRERERLNDAIRAYAKDWGDVADWSVTDDADITTHYETGQIHRRKLLPQLPRQQISTEAETRPERKP
jgi:hypothetical protein